MYTHFSGNLLERRLNLGIGDWWLKKYKKIEEEMNKQLTTIIEKEGNG